MDLYVVYILYSEKLSQYYTGMSSNIENRMLAHNTGLSDHTRKGIPWKLLWRSSQFSRKEALILERKIKKRAALRYLTDQKLI